jgi:hypothetical protein
MRGAATMLDFTGLLTFGSAARSAEEDMDLAWREVAGTVRLPAGSVPSQGGDLGDGDGIDSAGLSGERQSGTIVQRPSPGSDPEDARQADGQGLLFGEDVAARPEDIGYRGPTACSAAGISYRQLDY